MKCMEDQRNTEIINNLKRYFQNNIDKGYSKFVYNDYGLDEKNIDILNALDYFLENNTKQQKEIEKKNKIITEVERYARGIKDEELLLILKKDEIEKLVNECKDLLGE